MTKAMKIWIWIAAGLSLAGLIVGFAGLCMMSFDFSGAAIPKYEKKTYEVSEDFDKILIDTRDSDVVFALSGDGKCRVECDERARFGYSVGVLDGTLKVELVDGRKWYDYIQIFGGGAKMTVYLPKSQYDKAVIENTTGSASVPKDFSFKTGEVKLTTGDVKWQAAVSESLSANTSTGNITVSGVSPRALDLKASTGAIKVSDVNCATASLKATTGDVTLKGVVAAESLDVSVTTGDVSLDGCDGSNIFIKTTTGEVEGTLLSGKDFTATASTGKVRVPKDSAGGKCHIETGTGDIEISMR